MSNWMFVAIGAVGMWIVLGAVYGWMCECSSRGLENILEIVLSLPWVILAGVAVVVWYPFFCLWKFFRNAVKGVSAKCWETHKPDRHLKMGNLYLCYDPKARALCNKLFLVRVVVPRETIAHEPGLVSHDTPSTPPGEFR